MRTSKGSRKFASRGFTLIELMIVVAIIGILAAIAVPKFADLIRKSNEGATKGSLGAIRSALSIYYGDMEGQYPSDWISMTVGAKYMAALPPAKMPNYHTGLTTTSYGTATGATNDSTGWAYNNSVGDANLGTLWVNCTHTDTRATTWSTY